MNPSQRLVELFGDSAAVQAETLQRIGNAIVEAAGVLAECLLNDRKILVCGNGGGAAAAEHFAALMLNRYDTERPGLPAMVLTGNCATLTSIATEYQFADVFAKQIRALAQPGDTLLAIATGAETPDIVNAVDAAHERDARVILISGMHQGPATEALQTDDIALHAASSATPRVHEAQIVILHGLCELIDRHLLGEES